MLDPLYLAGLVDGEGHIGFHDKKGKRTMNNDENMESS